MTTLRPGWTGCGRCGGWRYEDGRPQRERPVMARQAGAFLTGTAVGVILTLAATVLLSWAP